MKKLYDMASPCAPTVLHYVSGVPEEIVIRLCRKHGYDKKGMYNAQWQKVAKELGIKIDRVLFTGTKLKDFIEKYHHGLFVVTTNGHIFAVHHGIVVDPLHQTPGLGRKITCAWRVYK